MIWWFFILAFSVAAVIWAGISVYMRVQRHMQVPEGASPSAARDPEIDRKT
jgi:hypothetical protein